FRVYSRAMRPRRSLFAPEVVQTSSMDCGPATLKCLLEGYGTAVSYGRLREACQTDVDGTSIDTMETVANQLGLEAEQIMAPAEHLLLPGAELLPAIVVVRLPSGITHFVVAWRRQGRWVQLMDPATGRRWPTCRRFLNELYIHRTRVPAESWREWAGSEEFLGAMRRRLGGARVSESAAGRVLDRGLEDPSWRGMAAVDAAARMVDSLVRSGGLGRGREAERVLDRFLDNPDGVPAHYWSVRPEPEGEGLI